mmetsp:Transcript_41509/g.111191  ORF Transcript_41509/g.111191 Transcript_41509/m.111191 type:complete len:110 (-) Transcript_41509:1630-1959(-)
MAFARSDVAVHEAEALRPDGGPGRHRRRVLFLIRPPWCAAVRRSGGRATLDLGKGGGGNVQQFRTAYRFAGGTKPKDKANEQSAMDWWSCNKNSLTFNLRSLMPDRRAA